MEWWNAGIMEKWVLGYCHIGSMAKFGLAIKYKIDSIRFSKFAKRLLWVHKILKIDNFFVTADVTIQPRS